MSNRRRGDRGSSCRRHLDLWSLLVFMTSFQVFVCVIVLPVLLLTSGGSRRLCELNESVGEERRHVRVRRLPESNARWGKFSTLLSVLDDQGVSDLIKMTINTPSRPVAVNHHHIPRPFTILTATNMGFADFAVNWLKSIRQLGIDYNVTIIAEDMDAHKYLQNLTSNDHINLSIVKTEYGLSSPKAQKFMHSGYRRLVNKRPQYLLDKLEDGFDILLDDVDSFWFKNPLDEIIPNYAKYDLWLARGHDGKDGHPLPCPCLMYLKSDIKSVGVVKHWISRLLRTHGMESDQQSLNYVLKTRHGKRMRIGWLAAGEFPTGDDYKKRKENNESMEDVFVYHANHMGGAPKKKTYMKSIGLWVI